MYRKDKKINFLQSVTHKRQKAKRYKTKEKGFFGGALSDHLRNGDADLDSDFYFPWEKTLQESIDLKSRHIFKNVGDELMKANEAKKAPPALDDDFFMDAKKGRETGTQKRKFKAFDSKALRLGDDGEFLHFTKAISKQKLAPEEFNIPKHSQQRFMDPEGWRSNPNFIPIAPEKNRLRLLKERIEGGSTSRSNSAPTGGMERDREHDDADDRPRSTGKYERNKKSGKHNRFDIGANQLRKVVKKSARRMKIRNA